MIQVIRVVRASMLGPSLLGSNLVTIILFLKSTRPSCLKECLTDICQTNIKQDLFVKWRHHLLHSVMIKVDTNVYLTNIKQHDIYSINEESSCLGRLHVQLFLSVPTRYDMFSWLVEIIGRPINMLYFFYLLGIHFWLTWVLLMHISVQQCLIQTLN